MTRYPFTICGVDIAVTERTAWIIWFTRLMFSFVTGVAAIILFGYVFTTVFDFLTIELHVPKLFAFAGTASLWIFS